MTTKFFSGIRNRTQPILGSTNKIRERLVVPELPQRLKGTIVEKWMNYWKNLFIDYKEVILDTGKIIKSKPIKSSVYGTIFGSLYYFGKTNPDFDSFNLQLRNYHNDIILINQQCHNKVSSEYLLYLERCSNEGILRRLSLGVVSFLWIDDYAKAVSIYKATCPYLQPQYEKFHERIIDIGFLNVWWNLKEKMVDYDVNE